MIVSRKGNNYNINYYPISTYDRPNAVRAIFVSKLEQLKSII